MNNYYIGLDIGTNSIGWATTDLSYSLCKFKGNAMWGIRLLEESQTAEERRLFRGARRRTSRNKFRLQCLEMLFNQEIAKVDVAFFQRLKESNLYMDDKSCGVKYSVFADAEYTDKHYHMQYPTIYHLRSELAHSKEPHDIRLVYLAVSHIVKNRGHFLFDSQMVDEDSVSDFSAVWQEFNLFLTQNYDFDFYTEDIAGLEEVLKDGTITKTKKKDIVAQLLSVSKKDKTQKQQYEIIVLLTGGTAKASELFLNEEYKQGDCKSVCLSSGFDENSAVYESTFKEDFELIEKAKAIYDWAILANILKGKKFLCDAKKEEYLKHKEDLKLLKAFVKQYCPDKYALIFKANKKGTSNYLAYSKHSKKASAEDTNCTQENFCEFLRKTLPKEAPGEQYALMYSEIAAGTFMPKMVTKDNAVIPMQVTKAELSAILDNASTYLSFLNVTDEYGVSTKEKILSVHSYRIPYYVGPLNLHSDNSWIVRTEEKIYPWNFERVVDTDLSAERFIENLTSKCTYLFAEDVIPKNSLLYSSFMVLNELNNLKINGEEISVKLKQEIYLDLFCRRNKVTQATLKKYLISKGVIKASDAKEETDSIFSGIDGDFKSSLKSFRDLYGYSLTDSQKEEIIKAITIFGDDRKLLRKRLKSQFGGVLTDDEIVAISKLKYTGWSRLSRKFLAGIEGVIATTGEVTTIIRALWETNNNLMQLLSFENTFSKAVQEENGEMIFTTLKKEVDSLYVSPKIKRPIYQTMQIVDEIVRIKGAAPKKIFVEVARGPEEKTRKVSRKNKLIELYQKCKKQEKELFELLQGYSESDLRRDALYLYFTQFGRCMYTGKKIELSELFNKNLYDIDHIFPRSKIKDDSLDNRVLVCKTANEKKSNFYPISEDVRKEMFGFWALLKEKGLISERKYDRLKRATPLSDDELSAFISRQLVETRQSTKAIAQLLQKRYPGTDIVYVKAGLVSDFRRDYEFAKSRDVNDLHHAKDAYLNIVVGNVYDTQFRINRFVYISGLQSGKFSVARMFDFDVKGAWSAKDDESLKLVRKMMSKNNVRFTRYSYKQKGGLFKQNILKKGSGQVSVKANSPVADILRYGGYDKATSTYFVLAEYFEKGNKVKAIVPVDLYAEKQYLNDPEGYVLTALRKVSKTFDADRVRIVNPCIKYNTLISVNGFRMHISSKSNGGAQYVCKPAVQLVLGGKFEQYIKRITNYLEKCIRMGSEQKVYAFDHLSEGENEELYDAITQKLLTTVFKEKFGKLGKTLNDKKESFKELTIYQQCVVLKEVLNILHADVKTGDLTLLDEAKKSGVASIGYKIVKSDTLTSFKIIHQSVTGLYEKEIELLD